MSELHRLNRSNFPINQTQAGNMIGLVTAQGRPYLVQRGSYEFGSHELYATSTFDAQKAHQTLGVCNHNRDQRRCHIGKISLKQ